jgi:hypothetical protein
MIPFEILMVPTTQTTNPIVLRQSSIQRAVSSSSSTTTTTTTIKTTIHKTWRLLPTTSHPKPPPSFEKTTSDLSEHRQERMMAHTNQNNFGDVQRIAAMHPFHVESLLSSSSPPDVPSMMKSNIIPQDVENSIRLLPHGKNRRSVSRPLTKSISLDHRRNDGPHSWMMVLPSWQPRQHHPSSSKIVKKSKGTCSKKNRSHDQTRKVQSSSWDSNSSTHRSSKLYLSSRDVLDECNNGPIQALTKSEHSRQHRSHRTELIDHNATTKQGQEVDSGDDADDDVSIIPYTPTKACDYHQVSPLLCQHVLEGQMWEEQNNNHSPHSDEYYNQVPLPFQTSRCTTRAVPHSIIVPLTMSDISKVRSLDKDDTVYYHRNHELCSSNFGAVVFTLSENGFDENIPWDQETIVSDISWDDPATNVERQPCEAKAVRYDLSLPQCTLDDTNGRGASYRQAYHGDPSWGISMTTLDDVAYVQRGWPSDEENQTQTSSTALSTAIPCLSPTISAEIVDHETKGHRIRRHTC